MSFILDALKKLEQEKAARRNADIKISDEIVRENRQVMRKARHSVPVSVVLVSLGLVLLLGISGAFLWHRHGAGDQSKVVAMNLEQKFPTAEEVPASQRPQMAVPAATPVGPVAAVEDEPSSHPVEANRMSRRERMEANRSSGADFKKRSAQPSMEVSGSGGSRLTVSGIAWQDAPSARRAVINGDLVQEGAQVGGATVEEIQPTRVRFSSGGRQFTVSISGPLVVK
ncbi:MAG: general secretion pathway protein GspB [Geobacteraceae bacterium]|nr:general secretion pathway protein GspB [Geobacteraceae bacterium]